MLMRDGVKTCSRCKESKSLNAFSGDKSRKDGLFSRCKECVHLYNENNKERISAQKKKWNDRNADKVREDYKKWRARNGEKYLAYQKQYYRANSERLKKCTRKWSTEHREKMRRYKAKWRRSHKAYHNAYQKNKLATDISYNIGNRLRARIRIALKTIRKSRRTEELVGCSMPDLKNRLEAMFTEGMTWEKFMKGAIHIDHIVPCSAFDLADPEQQKECFHYSNMQPLWARDNLIKNNRMPNVRSVVNNAELVNRAVV